MKRFIIISIFLLSNCLFAQKPIFYEKLYDYKNGHALVQNGDKFGFIDVDGNLVGQMDVARTKYTNNPLNLQGKSVYIDQQLGSGKDGVRKYSGEYILEPGFIIQPFNSFFIIRESTLDFMKPSIYKVMDGDGEIIYSLTTQKYQTDAIFPISNNLIGIKNLENDSYRYAIEGLNSDLKTDYVYRKFGALNEGLIKAQRYSDEFGKLKWGFLNDSGEEVIDFIYTEEPSNFSDRKAVVKNTDGKFGYIDTNNNIIIEPQFIEAYNFVDGKAVVRIYNYKRENNFPNTGYRLINVKGEIIYDFGEFRPVDYFITNQYDNIENSRLLRLKKDGKIALFSIDSFEIRETPFIKIGKFDGHRAMVEFIDKRERKFGYANEKGELVLYSQKKSQF